MITKKMYRQIQAFKRSGQSKKEIARSLNIDPKTVAKYYTMAEKDYWAYCRLKQFRERAFEDYEQEILEVYANNDNHRLNMASVYDYVEERYGPAARE